MPPERTLRTRRSSALGGADIGRCFTALHHDRFTPAPFVEDAVRDRLIARGRTFEDEVLERLRSSYPDAVTIPHADNRSAAVEATITAMEARAPLVIGGRLVDEATNGIGFPDLLVPIAGGYTAVEIKSHKVVGDSGPPAWTSDLDALQDQTGDEVRFRSSRRRDLLQVAHYRSLLATAGYASPVPHGGVIGTDQPTVCVWVDLSEGEQSIEDDYEAYLETAADVIAHGESDPATPLVAPFWRGECVRCVWADLCQTELEAASDPTLLRGIGAEMRDELSKDGVTTIADVADLPMDDPRFVDGEVVMQARARTADRLLRLDDGDGALHLPCPGLEVDFDIETINGRVYLAGLLLTEDGLTRFEPIADWDDSEQAERDLLTQLFARFAGWASEDVVVFHWTGYEPRTLTAAAKRHGLGIEGFDSVDEWFEAKAFDLYEWTRQHLVSPRGYSLKVIAPMCGFSWRDDDPGGLQSEIWYEALQAGDPSMRTRLLTYNEDDVIAQLEVRRWLRAQDSGVGPGSAIPSVRTWPHR